jgi:hypothetical protein
MVCRDAGRPLPSRSGHPLPQFFARPGRDHINLRRDDDPVHHPTIEGKSIQAYHGIVTGEAILGANIFKDISASIRDIVGGRSAIGQHDQS